MSVALFIETIDGRKPEKQDYVPVAAQQVYHHAWMPVCEKHQLKLFAACAWGLTFDENDIPALLEELKIIRKEIAEELERVDMLETALRAMQGHQVVFSIG